MWALQEFSDARGGPSANWTTAAPAAGAPRSNVGYLTLKSTGKKSVDTTVTRLVYFPAYLDYHVKATKVSLLARLALMRRVSLHNPCTILRAHALDVVMWRRRQAFLHSRMRDRVGKLLKGACYTAAAAAPGTALHGLGCIHRLTASIIRCVPPRASQRQFSTVHAPSCSRRSRRRAQAPREGVLARVPVLVPVPGPGPGAEREPCAPVRRRRLC